MLSQISEATVPQAPVSHFEKKKKKEGKKKKTHPTPPRIVVQRLANKNENKPSMNLLCWGSFFFKKNV